MELWTEAQGARDEWLNGSRAQSQARTISCFADPLILARPRDQTGETFPERGALSFAHFAIWSSTTESESRSLRYLRIIYGGNSH